MNNKYISISLIAIGFFILGLGIGLQTKPVEKVDYFIVNEKVVETIRNRNKLPFGYRMETNGTEFAYVDDKGYRTLFPNDSLEKEIQAAWSYYEYKKKKEKDSWSNFEIDKNTN